jgi:Flp pilus assembly protein TadG
MITQHKPRLKSVSPVRRRKNAVAILARDEGGIVAVEFALILPVMLVLYLGLVEFSQGYRVSQKLDLLAHTLSDLTAQQLTGGQANGQAGIDQTTIDSIFSSAIPIMTPISNTTVEMTISEVVIAGVPNNNSPTSWKALVNWTIARNSGALRNFCGTPLLALDTAAISSNSMPTSYTQVKSVTVGGAAANVTPSLGAIIVADVAYNYKPGFSFVPFNWSAKPTFRLQKTAYAPVRNTYTPNHIQYFMTAGTNCNAPTP